MIQQNDSQGQAEPGWGMGTMNTSQSLRGQGWHPHSKGRDQVQRVNGEVSIHS